MVYYLQDIVLFDLGTSVLFRDICQSLVMYVLAYLVHSYKLKQYYKRTHWEHTYNNMLCIFLKLLEIIGMFMIKSKDQDLFNASCSGKYVMNG